MNKLYCSYGRTAFAVALCLISTLISIPGLTADYRIAYVEGGPFWAFERIMAAVKTALEEQGWGERIVFPEDTHISPGWGNSAELHAAIDALMARDDLAMIISAGTGTTAAVLERNNQRTPIYAIAVSDAIKSGFVESAEDSGIDNFTVRVVPDRYQRMFEIFHFEVGFQKLGLLYVDDPSGRDVANLEDARTVATAQDFELLEYAQIGADETVEDCLAGLQDLLARGMDAFYIPSLSCFDWSSADTQQLIDFLLTHKIPTFARNGSDDVKAGTLMGFSSIDFSNRGKFIAENIIQILQGTSPREVIMVDDAQPKISLNIATAQAIGYDFSFNILGASDEVYEVISPPDNRLVK